MRISRITGIISLFLISIMTACNETPKRVESDSFFDKLSEGTASKEEIDSLLEAHGVQVSYTVKVPGDHFEITFPVNKKHVKKSVDTQIINNEEIETYEYKANMQREGDVNLAYQLSYNHVEDLKTDKEIKKMFDDQRDYWLSATNSEIEYEKLIDLNGIPGRDLLVTVDDSDLKVSCKMYYDQGIFYRLVVVTQDGNLFNKSISKFLDSFKILNK